MYTRISKDLTEDKLLLQCNKQWKFHRNQLMGTRCFCAGSNNVWLQVRHSYHTQIIRCFTYQARMHIERGKKKSCQLPSVGSPHGKVKPESTRNITVGSQNCPAGHSWCWLSSSRLHSPAPLKNRGQICEQLNGVEKKGK